MHQVSRGVVNFYNAAIETHDLQASLFLARLVTARSVAGYILCKWNFTRKFSREG
jgi:hypothetical protein